MVQYRGISISMISQHTIRKLPEYRRFIAVDPSSISGSSVPSENDSSVSCYVPSYPGTQIWFDYSIENPHPPNAQYFFKLLHNGKGFTSWDCTAKHDYQGRTTFGLKYLGTHPQTGLPVIERQAFRFSDKPPSQVGPFDDCIELRVHRIDHRERLPLDAANIATDEALVGEDKYQDGLRLVNGGLLGPNDPKRRYKYQLLDPVDKPYAIIRLYYRPLEYLRAMGVVAPPSSHSRQTSTASDQSYTSSESMPGSRAASIASSARSPARSESSTRSGSSRSGTPPTDSVTAWLRHHRLQKYISILATLSFDTLVTLSDDDLARLGVAAKGSRAKLLRELEIYQQQHHKEAVEAAQEEGKEKENATVNQAPKPARSCLSKPGREKDNDSVSPAAKAALSSSSKSSKKVRPSLTVQINGVEFDLEKQKKKRPLSPFTPGGRLRRLLSPQPPSAPARITAFGPTIDDEVNEMLAEMESGGQGSNERVGNRRTTRAERGGGMLTRMLGRRISRG